MSATLRNLAEVEAKRDEELDSFVAGLYQQLHKVRVRQRVPRAFHQERGMASSVWRGWEKTNKRNKRER